MTQTHWKKYVNTDYLGAYSLVPGEDMVLTIKEVLHENVVGPDGKKEKCIVIHWKENQKPFICNRTNAKTITSIYDTPYIEDWSGKRIQLTATKVNAFGEKVEALRVVAKANPTVAPSLAKIENCETCGNPIQAFKNMTAQQVGVYTNRKYGKTVCVTCAEKLKALEDQPETKNEDLTNQILGGKKDE